MEVVARLRHRLGRTRRSLRGRARGRQRKKENSLNPREGWEDRGTPPPPHRDFKERSVVLARRPPSC